MTSNQLGQLGKLFLDIDCGGHSDRLSEVHTVTESRHVTDLYAPVYYTLFQRPLSVLACCPVDFTCSLIPILWIGPVEYCTVSLLHSTSYISLAFSLILLTPATLSVHHAETTIPVPAIPSVKHCQTQNQLPQHHTGWRRIKWNIQTGHLILAHNFAKC